MNNGNFKRTKIACYFSNLIMASVFCLPPMLFVTFREMYGISYTLLGTLVLINFCTQLGIDLIFSFFSKYFNIKLTVRVMPLLTSLGLFVYTLVPMFFPEYAYVGLVAGTVIFSVSAGLSEVLLSPLVAAIPSDTPDKDMSFLHSLYAYGVVTSVLSGIIVLKVFGTQNWMYLTMLFAVLMLVPFFLLSTSPIPEMMAGTPEKSKNTGSRKVGMLLCMLCIFFGSAAENSMTNWISSFAENALAIPKALGDSLGMLMFGIFLGLARTWYAKKGKNIQRVLTVSMAGALVCYLVAALSPVPAVALVACVITGLSTSMLWPGTLILMEEKYPACGVTAYALMAAGGDFGASVAPQMLGIVVDKVSVSSFAVNFAQTLSLTPEQIGMKAGMLTAAVFPFIGVIVLLVIKKYFKKQNTLQNI